MPRLATDTGPILQLSGNETEEAEMAVLATRSATVAARAAVGVAMALALGCWLTGLGAAPAGAVVDNPDIDSDAAYRYEVDPAAGVVDVTVELAVTADKPNSSVSGGSYYQYYFDGFALAIPAGVDDLRVTDGTGRILDHSLDDSIDGVLVVAIEFRRNLFYRQTADVVVSYSLLSGPARSESFTRVNEAYAGFEVWTDPQLEEASVTVIAPSGFEDLSTGSDRFATEAVEGATALVAEAVDPENFWAAVSLARDERLRTAALEIEGHAVEIRSWPGDRRWVEHVTGTLEDGLPTLIDQVGLAWPVDGELTIIESYSPYLSGYAGWYDPLTDEIEIGDELDRHVVLHELSHVWFNGKLFINRWITEGLADEFGAAVTESMGDERPGPPPTSLLDGVAQPLNRWAVYGADEEEEVWSYGASWTVTQAIVEEVGLDALSAVVTAATDDEIAYLGDAAPERGYLRHDWRLYLDLIENRGGVEGDEIQDIFVAWVLTETEASSLEVRAEARTRYAELEHDGGHWAPPLGVRVAMSDWNFDEADELLGLASSLLDERDRIEDVLDPLGASLPGRLEASYEGADGGFDETTALMGEVSAAAAGLRDSHDRIEAATGVLQRIGGIGSDHRDDLEAAVDAFEAGELDRAARASAEIDRDVAGLTRAGLGRLALAALFIAGSVGVVVWLARRRQRGPGAPPAVVSSPRSLPPAPSGGPWSREVPGSPEARGAPHGPAHRGWWRPGLPPPWRRRSERPTPGPGRTRPAPGDT